MLRGPERRDRIASLAIAIAAASLWVTSTASAQAGTPYYPNGYGGQASVQASVPLAAPLVPAYTPRTTSIRGLWIPGLVGLPVAWVATWANASLALTAGSDAVSAAFIPIAGPWMVLAAQNVDVGYYVTTGLVQDISLICLVLGLVIRVPEPSARIALGDATLELAASPTASGGAFSALLQF